MDIPLTINQIQEGLKNKKFTAVDLIDWYLERIDKVGKKLNCFITVSREEAYEKAKWVDKTLEQLGDEAFKKYPLLGVTVTHKDNFLTKGIRTTAASKVLESFIPAYSATVVQKLNSAGAITLAKANMDAWAHGSSGENSDFGPALNPWDETRVPGGSSSGSAVSVAANLSLISTGSDTCGSIRLPANYCGVYGFKPTYGTVSRYGIIAMASSLDSIGHFARSVEDIEKVLQITKGIDGHDSTLVDYQPAKPKAKIKIGIPKEFFIDGLDRDVERAVLEASQVFKKQEIELVDISLPYTKYGISVYYIIQPAEVSSNLGRFDGIRFGNNRKLFSEEAKRRIMLGTYVLSSGYYDTYYLKAMKVRSKIIEDINKAFEAVDVLIAPVAPTPAFKLGEKTKDPLKMYLTDIFAATANLCGLPSLAIPSGFTKQKLPLGFQLMGPKFSENIIFELAKLFEKVTGFQPETIEI